MQCRGQRPCVSLTSMCFASAKIPCDGLLRLETPGAGTEPVSQTQPANPAALSRQPCQCRTTAMSVPVSQDPALTSNSDSQENRRCTLILADPTATPCRPFTRGLFPAGLRPPFCSGPREKARGSFYNKVQAGPDALPCVALRPERNALVITPNSACIGVHLRLNYFQCLNRR